MTISRPLAPLSFIGSRHLLWLAGLSWVSLLGCSSNEDGTADPHAGAGASAGGSAAGTGSSASGNSSTGGAGNSGSSDGVELLGTFKVEVTADDSGPTSGTTSVLGKVNTGAAPSAVVWEEVASDGACRLEKPRVPFCTPSCGADVCVEDDVCRAYPAAQSVGEVTLSGVQVSGGGASLVLKEVAKAYQPPAGTLFAYPPFQPGDAVKLKAAGAELPGFELESTGISPLWITSSDLTLVEGAPLELSWDADSSAKASSIHVKLDISHHGGSKGMIECDQDDTGSLSIAASLVSELLGLGVAGFPTIIVTRAATSKARVGNGEVALVVASTTERAVTVPGLESCTGDEDCPDGETCQADLTCQ